MEDYKGYFIKGEDEEKYIFIVGKMLIMGTFKFI
ncbi:hypothetical protein TheetDRAFT_3168 [Thermoanaerobacter ethanolicus JW 200]|nr:hypothetical protein TheetDRAFT_3168 [Thermoanaerobacter ethanolicus JW 200]